MVLDFLFYWLINFVQRHEEFVVDTSCVPFGVVRRRCRVVAGHSLNERDDDLWWQEYFNNPSAWWDDCLRLSTNETSKRRTLSIRSLSRSYGLRVGILQIGLKLDLGLDGRE